MQKIAKKSTINSGGRMKQSMVRDVGLKKIRLFRVSKLFETKSLQD
jgi:hypothetical protein